MTCFLQDLFYVFNDFRLKLRICLYRSFKKFFCQFSHILTDKFNCFDLKCNHMQLDIWLVIWSPAKSHMKVFMNADLSISVGGCYSLKNRPITVMKFCS